MGEAGLGGLFPAVLVFPLPPGFPGELEVEGAGGLGIPEEVDKPGAVLDAGATDVALLTEVAGAVVGVVEVCAGTEGVLVVVAAVVVLTI